MAKKGKKDFDKDMMYQKIMPSAGQEAQGSGKKEAVSHVDAVLPRFSSEHASETPRLHNFMEEIVAEKMDGTMMRLGVCTCPRCRMDILAIALNQLPAAYAVTDKGTREQYLTRFKGTHDVKITAAIIRAVQQVKENPRH